MADAATRTTTIAARSDELWAIVTDFERYPEWARDIESATVTTRDDEGRAVEVDFRAGAFGRSAHYTLFYDYAGAPASLSWKLVRGDIMRAIDGAYTFTPSPTDPGATDVVYELSIELVVPLPGFVKRRAEVRILNTLKELKARAEA
jgi:hypothetical protein